MWRRRSPVQTLLACASTDRTAVSCQGSFFAFEQGVSLLTFFVTPQRRVDAQILQEFSSCIQNA